MQAMSSIVVLCVSILQTVPYYVMITHTGELVDSDILKFVLTHHPSQPDGTAT